MSRFSKRSKARAHKIQSAQLEEMKRIGNPQAADKILKYIDGMSAEEKISIDKLDMDGKLNWFNKILGNV